MRVEAPGKLVLVGEYAVLDGAPALVAAVDRGVACEVAPADERTWSTPGGDDRFVRAALEAVGALPARYTFSDWNPVTGLERFPGTKPGLGGSAAATVAAIVAGSERLSPGQVFARALEVHRAVQGGGSGIDVAASAYGGILRFEAGEVSPAAPVEPAVVFTGRAAASGPRVARGLAWPRRAEVVRRSRELVEAFPAEPVRVLEEAGALLRSMSEAAGIDYWTAEIAALARLARAHGGAAKPSGAGGGDVVVALFPEPERTAAFLLATREAGFLPIEVRVAPGARAVARAGEPRPRAGVRIR